MNSSQLIASQGQKPTKNGYFKEGLRYLISGAYQCFSGMEGCNVESLEDQDRASNLIEQLKEKIALFCSSHLKTPEQGRKTSKSSARRFEVEVKNEADPDRLISELKSVRRKNTRLAKANLRLKRVVRQQKISLTELRYGFSHQVEQATSKYEAKLESLVSDLKQQIPPTPNRADQQDESKQNQTENKSADPSPSQPQETQTVGEEQEEPGQSQTQNSPQEPQRLTKLLDKVSNKSVQIPSRYENQAQFDLEVPLMRKFKADLDQDLSITKELQTQQNILYQNYLKQRDKYRINQIEVDVQELASHAEEGIIGEQFSLLAVKSEKSYMIGTYNNGLKLVEDGTEVFSAKLPNNESTLRDIIYIKHHNCYILCIGEKLYRKDINSQDPFIFMDVNIGYQFGACFRYSQLNQRLFVHLDFNTLSVVNLEAKEIEIEVEERHGALLCYTQIFGEKEDRVLCYTNDGHLLLYRIDYAEKSESLVCHKQLDFIGDRGEQGLSLGLCSKQKYVLAGLRRGEMSKYVCSRLVLLELRGDSLVTKSSFDQHTERIGSNFGLHCLEYVGQHALWVGISAKNGVVQIFDYDTETGEFRCLRDKMVAGKEVLPVMLNQVNGKFFYTGTEGRVMRLSIKI